MTLIESATYATSVFHYQHVVSALRNVSANVTLARRFELTSTQVDYARRMRAPGAVVKVLERRTTPTPSGVQLRGLGASQFIPPIVARVPANISPRWKHVVARNEARHVARRLKPGTNLFQFVSGLGHATLSGRRSQPDLTICERRHLHHEVLETDPGVVGDMPFTPRLDAIRDILEYEYENADHIFVYSQIARESFIERGFAPDRIHVAPLGVPTPLPQIESERNPYQIAFVGRADIYKGIDIAVETVRQLGAPYHLKIAGPADQRMKDWVSRQPRTEHVGILGKSELRELYSKSAVLLAPSIESFGYAPMEGASHGARLVCARTTGAREFLSADAHRAVDGRDVSVWATAVLDSIEQLEPETIAASARASIETLSWENSAKHVENLYRRLLA